MGIIPNQQPAEKLSVLFIGAHPDDADIQFGGTAIRYLQAGHTVNYVSVTNGDAGHQSMGGGALAQRRRGESRKVADYLGIQYIVLDNHDGELQPTIENRHKIIEIVRELKADLIITHRPNDYHPDHRNTSLLVQDSAYLFCVPNVVPFTPRSVSNPVIVYHQDRFKKPYPFIPEIVVDVTDVIDQKIEALSFHESQLYEWLPWIEGYLDDVPQDPSARLPWLKQKWASWNDAPNLVSQLGDKLPPEELGKLTYVEAFERCEYGGQLTKENVKTLFPFGIINF